VVLRQDDRRKIARATDLNDLKVLMMD
jgi:hypothetical protein